MFIQRGFTVKESKECGSSGSMALLTMANPEEALQALAVMHNYAPEQYKVDTRTSSPSPLIPPLRGSPPPLSSTPLLHPSPPHLSSTPLLHPSPPPLSSIHLTLSSVQELGGPVRLLLLGQEGIPRLGIQASRRPALSWAALIASERAAIFFGVFSSSIGKRIWLFQKGVHLHRLRTPFVYVQ